MTAITFANLLFSSIENARTLEQLISEPLDWASRSWHIQHMVLLSATKGSWKRVVQVGRPAAVGPDSLHASESLDARLVRHIPPWVYYPVPSKTRQDLVLCCHGVSSHWASDTLLEPIQLLGQAVDAWHRHNEKTRELDRLNQILNVVANWHVHQNLEQLLEEMARAATQLVRCDRASIFLWDKNARELVGHPALGMEGKPLRIADDKGVAGKVLKTQQPRRWDRSDPHDEVDRRVDTRSGYRTDSLLAVPMNDARGKAMGVFEVINHVDGRFDQQDERDLIELARHASAALANTQTMQRLVETRDRLTADALQQIQLIGDSPEMRNLKATIARVGDTDLAVLILGENGTGKEVVSRQIHYQSKRRYEPFIAVNCAAITETLLESELFGHEKGAFTDAHETRTGKFEMASGGTLFLDEIGDMSLAGQSKLLRVLEEKVVVRVGGSSPIPVNVRVIAATNQNLVDLVRLKKFREDLYFRLTVVAIQLPPLRQRGEDVIALADFFLTTFCNKIGRTKPSLSASAKRRLAMHDWPGNVRELRNVIERIAYLTTEETIEESQIDFVRSPRSDAVKPDEAIDLSQTLADATAEFQICYIEQQIKAAQRNITQAAERMGLQRSNLYRKMKQLGMKSPDGEI
jgi:transcriptional regulator with GAF, ATPase, and Fis domain